jgi:hypothetical protein
MDDGAWHRDIITLLISPKRKECKAFIYCDRVCVKESVRTVGRRECKAFIYCDRECVKESVRTVGRRECKALIYCDRVCASVSGDSLLHLSFHVNSSVSGVHVHPSASLASDGADRRYTPPTSVRVNLCGADVHALWVGQCQV